MVVSRKTGVEPTTQPLKPTLKPTTSTFDRKVGYKVKAAAYTVGAKVLSHFDKAKAERLSKVASYYKNRSKSAKANKAIFGKNAIHFSVNFEEKKTLGQKPSMEKAEAVYEKAIHPEIKPGNVRQTPLKFDKQHRELCQASSTHCIKKYHSYLKKGHPEKEAFFLATKHYRKGASEKIALTQTILHQGETTKKASTPASQDNRIRLETEDAYFTKFYKLSNGEHVRHTRRDFFTNFPQVQPGSYLVSFLDSRNYSYGHAIMIVKNQDGSLSIFDPSLGAAIVPKKEAEKCLRKLTVRYSAYGDIAYTPVSPTFKSGVKKDV